MQSVDEMPVNQAIELYYEKHHALRQGNLIKLIEMKKQYPEIFDKTKDRQISDLIVYAKRFEQSDQYKQMRRLMLKEMLTIIDANHEND